MYLIVTIDTEEDNWGEYDRSSFSVHNLARIPRLQQIFDARGVRPTYLITYPVATSAIGLEVLGPCLQNGRCEIGTHLHAWSTPPVEEERNDSNSFVNHLPADLQLRKIRSLHEAIEGSFGVRPTSFRSGRWGFSEDVARHLIRLNYLVDTSISPALDWQEYGGPDYSGWSIEPFVYKVDDCGDERGGSLLEVPATVDFLQSPRTFARAAYRSIKSVVPYGDKVLAALRRVGALNRICMSPELEDADQMIRLTRALIERDVPVVNMFFHSPSLLEGCSPFVGTSAELEDFLVRIDRFVEFAVAAGLQPATMSELATVELAVRNVRILPLGSS